MLVWLLQFLLIYSSIEWLLTSGADPGGGGGGAHPARAPLKLEKIWFFVVKSWFFTRNTSTIFAPPSAIGKKIRFFGVKLWFFTRNTPKMFAPPSARRNFFKCAPPLTWNPGSAPGPVYLEEEFEDLYQSGNQNPYIDGQKKKDKPRSTKHTHKTNDRVTRTPLKTVGALRRSGRVRNSCSTSGTCRENQHILV